MYISCPRRKGSPRVHIKVCKLICEDKKCPERKKLPRFRVAKQYSKKV